MRMPFQTEKNKIRSDKHVTRQPDQNIIISLQIKLKKKAVHNSDLSSGSGKVSSSFPEEQGSLVVEAAFILPLFLYCCTVFLWFLQVLYVQTTVEQALCRTSRELVVQAYAWKAGEAVIGSETEADALLVQGGGLVWIRSQMEDQLEGMPLCARRSYVMSEFMGEEEIIDIVLCYKMYIPVPFLRQNELDFTQRARCKAWTGYVGSQDGNAQEVFVYVAENGVVYHTDESCTHIRLSIQSTKRDQIASDRNEYGGRYYPCERCTGEGGHGSEVYITTSGDRYHARASCSGLKRRVSMIPLSETGGRRLCARCTG